MQGYSKPSMNPKITEMMPDILLHCLLATMLLPMVFSSSF